MIVPLAFSFCLVEEASSLAFVSEDAGFLSLAVAAGAATEGALDTVEALALEDEAPAVEAEPKVNVLLLERFVRSCNKEIDQFRNGKSMQWVR